MKNGTFDPDEYWYNERLKSIRDLIKEASSIPSALPGVIRIAPTAGEPFTLKSGRRSRYFFNVGAFGGKHFVRLCHHYWQKMVEVGIQNKVRIIYGPAYKGIPLAVGIHHEMGLRDYDIGYLFDRKEVKDHGDGGSFVGRVPNTSFDLGKRDHILIVDDVITDGATKIESIRRLKEAFGPYISIIGLMIAFDRQEVALPDLGIPIWSLITASEYFGDEHPDRHG